MKAVFIFDTVLVKKKDNNYYGMTLTYDFFKNRYLTFFDEITVTTRYRDKVEVSGDIEGYKITNGENVDIIPIKNYKEIPDILKAKKIKKELTKIISKCDIAIIRMPSVLGIMACKICKKLNKDYRIELVACPLDGYWNHTNPIGKIIAPFMYFKTKKCVKNAPKVLYVTKKFLQKRYPTDGEEYSASDVVIEARKDEILEKRLQKIKNMSEKEIKLCTVANVGLKSKGQKYVIKAISKLNKNNHNKYKYYLVRQWG